ncbi:MAG: hypothetical protein ACLFMM_00890 [Methanohalobium sp.]|uniref:hypothetical protein n=1 Tax=Methanohalobium sp. TaxID=2837493 RepID=UPI003979E48F
MNNKLGLSKEELDTLRKPKKIIVANILNKSLCNYNTIPVLTFLLVIRKIAKNYMYL